MLIRLFSQNLSGEALEWYISQDPRKWIIWGPMAKDFMERFQFNIEVVPDRYYLKKIKKKSTENFCEYVICWRAEDAIVQPSMSEEELTTTFIRV